mmetsp:Transcript_79340/g.256963  ORF Transcript_79340/g.256963 Transcript_79340/m.256963 type:complete len:292 (+) Transcript_79340:961-1836(+)
MHPWCQALRNRLARVTAGLLHQSCRCQQLCGAITGGGGLLQRHHLNGGHGRGPRDLGLHKHRRGWLLRRCRGGVHQELHSSRLGGGGVEHRGLRNRLCWGLGLRRLGSGRLRGRRRPRVHAHGDLPHNLHGLYVHPRDRDLPLHRLLDQMRDGTVDGLLDLLVYLSWHLDDALDRDLPHLDPRDATDHLADLGDLDVPVLVLDLGDLDDPFNLAHFDLWHLARHEPHIDRAGDLVQHLLYLRDLHDPVYDLRLRDLNKPLAVLDLVLWDLHDALIILRLQVDILQVLSHNL